MSPNNERGIYRELSKLVLHPKSTDLKVETYSGFVAGILLDMEEDNLITPDQIVVGIEQRYNLKGMSQIIVQDSLNVLKNDGIALKAKKGWGITPKGKKIIQERSEKALQLHGNMLESFISIVEELAAMKLDRYQSHFVKTALERSLFSFFELMSKQAVAYVHEKRMLEKHHEERIVIQKEIVKQAREMKEPEIEEAEKIKQILPKAIEEIFLKLPDEFSQGLSQIANKHTMWRILGADPELVRFREELFKGASVLVDTNILIASLCEGSQRHSVTKWILEASKSVGVEIIISSLTEKEYAQAVDNADRIYRRYHNREISGALLLNEITRTYIEKKGTLDWSGHISRMNQGVKLFVDEWDASVRKVPESTIKKWVEDNEKLKKIIRRMVDTDLIWKPEALIEHDALNLLLVQQIRRERKVQKFSSPWFLTHHFALLRADRVIQKQNQYFLPSCISCETWFQLLYPFLWAETDTSNANRTFAKILSSRVLPISGVSVKSFVGYIAGELDLSADSESMIQRIIQDSHLRRVLENALNQGNVSVSFDLFTTMLSETIENDEELRKKNEIISRLSKQVKAIKSPTPVLLEGFNIKEFRYNIEQIKKAGTNVEKGNSLENFGEYFISLFEGFNLIGKNVNTQAEEIDLIVENEAAMSWGNPIIIECKNWSKPVGKTALLAFIDNLRQQQCSTGILLAMNDITGTNKSDAKLKAREVLKDEKIRLVIITLSDLEEISEGSHLETLLKKRFYKGSFP